MGKIQLIIEKNGIMDSSGQTLINFNIERHPNFSFKKIGLNLGVFKLYSSLEKEPILLIVFPLSINLSESIFSSISDFLIHENCNCKEIIILSPIWNLAMIDLYEHLTLALKCIKKSSSYSIIPAMIHPDLLISELSDDKHLEAIYCLGKFSSDIDIGSSFFHYDFKVHQWKSILNEQIVVWGIVNRSDSLVKYFQIPLFQKFTDQTIQSSVNLPFCNSLLKKINENEIISKGKLVYGINSLGIIYFGKF